MPFNLAVFNKNAASKIINNNKEITSWYLAGHSLGGAMASSYCKENYSRLDGLILLAAYPLNDSAIDTLSISGTNDLVLTHSSEFPVLKQYKIQGGNHANFGNYGTQKGDGIAEISREEQQEITKDKIIEFIKR